MSNKVKGPSTSTITNRKPPHPTRSNHSSDQKGKNATYHYAVAQKNKSGRKEDHEEENFIPTVKDGSFLLIYKDINVSKLRRSVITTRDIFINNALRKHNLYRKRHGAEPLKIDREICAVAQFWANKLARDDVLTHSTVGLGENVYWTNDKKMDDGNHPVESWYSEVSDFDFEKIGRKKGTGHFTQMVWKSSKRFGIALAVGRSGTFIVANYEPAGNVRGYYIANIGKPANFSEITIRSSISSSI